MILGIGTDIVAIPRMEGLLSRHGERAAAKLLAASERAGYDTARHAAAYLAKRFAAKEALGKALGLGLREPATLRNIAVGHDALGRPHFSFAPPLEAWLHARQLTAWLSLSDDSGVALAFVVVEQKDSHGC